MRKEDTFFLGVITKKHGLKGHVVAKLDTDQPQLYNKLESILLETNGLLVPFFIKEIQSYQNNGLKILFEDTDLESADALLKKEMYLPLDHLPKLKGNQFYYHEVIGYSLIVDHKIVGKIEVINDAGPQDLFIIKNAEEKEILVPVIKDWILEVDRENNSITMQLPDGLIELY